jgi:hypothetical protein
MKRRELTGRQKRNAHLAGAILFPIINLALIVVLRAVLGDPFPVYGPISREKQDVFLGLPWLVNGGVTLLLYLFRPHAILGYIALPFVLILLAIFGSVLFVASCLAGVIATGLASLVLGPLGGVLGIAAGGGLFLWGLIRGWEFMLPSLSRWWAGGPHQDQQPGDAEVLRRLQRGEIEIGDDGELSSPTEKRDHRS